MQTSLRSAALRLGQNFLGNQLGAAYSLAQNVPNYVASNFNNFDASFTRSYAAKSKIWLYDEAKSGALTPALVENPGPLGYPVPTTSGLPATVHALKNVNHKIEYDLQYYSRMPVGAPTRRAFVYFVITAARCTYVVWWRLTILTVLVHFQPARDRMAVANIEVDISKITEGQNVVVQWRGKPVFIRKREARDIEMARKVLMEDLRHPESDEERVVQPEWLVLIGICTHLGCVPIANSGEFQGGYFCPCHGSHYDASGRIRKGPAPYNLDVPPYSFLDENTVLLGGDS